MVANQSHTGTFKHPPPDGHDKVQSEGLSRRTEGTTGGTGPPGRAGDTVMTMPPRRDTPLHDSDHYPPPGGREASRVTDPTRMPEREFVGPGQ